MTPTIIRRALWLLITLIFLSACTQKSKGRAGQQQSGTDPSSALLDNDPVQSQAVWLELWKFMTYSEDMPPLDRVVQLMGLSEKDFLQLTPNDALSALHKLREAVELELIKLDEQNMPFLEEYGTALYNLREEGKAIPDSTLAKLQPFKEKGLHIEDAAEGGFAFALIEPTIPRLAQYLPEDYQAIWKDTEVFRSYLMDATVVVSWKELGEAVIRFEHFAEKYAIDQDGLHCPALNATYIPLQSAYLFGVDNHPITANGEAAGPLDAEIKEEYRRFSQAYPNSPTSNLIKLLLAEPTITEEVIRRVRQAHKAFDYPLWSHYYASESSGEEQDR